MIVVVTGATDGIGYQTALELSSRGHTVVVHGRSEARAMAAASTIAKESGHEVGTAVADFGSLKQVRAMAAALTAEHPRIDVLVNNAGIFATKLERSEDGFEMTIAVNHLAHFVLTHLLLPVVAKSDQGRLVHVASGVHSSGQVDLADLVPNGPKKTFDGYDAYASSKIMNVLFSNELARRLQNTTITSNSLHPGVIATKLLRAGFGGGGSALEKGARTSVHVATDPSLAKVTGAYFSDARQVASSAQSRDPDLARALYDASCVATGVRGDVLGRIA